MNADETMPLHEFKLVIARDADLAPGDLAALAPSGCVLVSREDASQHVAFFERRAADYFEAVEAAIEAVETHLPGSRVVEIEGVPLPMPGLAIRATISRDDFDDLR